MTTWSERLCAPFDAKDLEWRALHTGISGNGRPWVRCCCYVTARGVQQRLDDVVGAENWATTQPIYTPIQSCGGFVVGISIRRGDEWITKYDGSELPDTEPFKGGISGAIKRAAVNWGIGRYLYDLPESFARDVITERRDGYLYAKIDGKAHYWLPPELPSWALPKDSAVPEPSGGFVDPTVLESANEMIESLRGMKPDFDRARELIVEYRNQVNSDGHSKATIEAVERSLKNMWQETKQWQT